MRSYTSCVLALFLDILFFDPVHDENEAKFKNLISTSNIYFTKKCSKYNSSAVKNLHTAIKFQLLSLRLN